MNIIDRINDDAERIRHLAGTLTSAHKILEAIARREELRAEFYRTGSEKTNGEHAELSIALRIVGAL